MLITHWIALLIASSSSEISAEIHNLVFSSIKQLFTDRSYYQLTVFLNTTSLIHNLILPKALQEVPSIVIDLADQFHISSIDRFLSLTAIQEPRVTTIFMILYIKTNVYQLQDLINSIANLSPTSERPRCLLVQIDVGASDQVELERLSRHAWSAYKFLDFSILSSIHEPQPLIFYYNPFTDLFYQNHLDVNVHIFPDKLRNMHGSKIFVPVLYDPPFMTGRRNRRGMIVNIDGIGPFVYKEIAKRMNFTLEYVEDLEAVEPANRTIVLHKLLAEYRINTSMFPLSTNTRQQLGQGFVISREIYQTNYGLLLPNIQELRGGNPRFLDVYVLSLSLIILCFFLMAQVLRFATFSSFGSWRTIYLVQVLLGSSSPKPPRQTAQRIVFFSLILLSLDYSTDMFPKLLNNKMKWCNCEFKSIQQVLRANLSVKVSEVFYNDIYMKNDDLVAQLGPRPETFRYLIQCVRMIQRTRKVGCVTSQEYGMSIIRYSPGGSWKTPDNLQFLTFGQFQLFSDVVAPVYAPSSPIAHRLERYMRLVFVHGILTGWRSKMDYDKSENEKTAEVVAETGITKSEFREKMKMILSRGYLVAFIAFLGELIVDLANVLYIKRKMKQRY